MQAAFGWGSLIIISPPATCLPARRPASQPTVPTHCMTPLLCLGEFPPHGFFTGSDFTFVAAGVCAVPVISTFYSALGFSCLRNQSSADGANLRAERTVCTKSRHPGSAPANTVARKKQLRLAQTEPTLGPQSMMFRARPMGQPLFVLNSGPFLVDRP